MTTFQPISVCHVASVLKSAAKDNSTKVLRPGRRGVGAPGRPRPV